MTVTKLTLLSPAKLNLFLNINGQLENGYHELQSLFHFLDYGDEMTFIASPNQNNTGTVNLSCNIKALESQDNLIFKAANKLKQHAYDTGLARCSSLPNIQIDLNKKLPMGGGVGGGSSNAATTLLALNKLWNFNLSIPMLETIGLSIGADVPIFVNGQTAIADGVGEKLTNYPIKEKWYLVLTPKQNVNTAELFSSPLLPRNSPKIPLDEIKYQGIESQFKNDFEKLVYNRYPNVAKSLDWLLEYGPARMTGTGACVFAEFDTQNEAKEVHNRLPVDLTGFVAKGCNTSPTHQTLFG